MQHVQTKREITELLTGAGVRPRKRFGQHFLIDGNLMRRLCEAGEVGPDDRVLEVGGGTGGLTDLLVERAAEVICVEVDPRLHGLLDSRFADRANFRLILGDVLASKHRLNPEVVRAIQDEQRAGRVKLVANLPYQIATPLVMNLLLDHPSVTRLVFTVQREVAERLTAGPGSKAYGPVSILTQLLCRVQTVATLSPDVFWPRPAVESAMLRIDVGASPFADGQSQQADCVGPLAGRAALHGFVDLVRKTFEHRRKTLRSALGYVLDVRQRNAICTTIDATRRPESFSIEEWLAMYHVAAGVG